MVPDDLSNPPSGEVKARPPGAGRASRFGPPQGAWYPVARERAVKRSLSVFLLDEALTLTRDGSGAIRVDPAADWVVETRLGLVWARRQGDAARVAPPLIEDAAGTPAFPMIACSEIEVEADYDQTVLGLVDPAHVPMVHTAWWWRSSDTRRVKTKHYTPSPFGFIATAADSFASAPAYELVGADRKVTIEFRLPSTRIERVDGGRLRLLNITTVTPVAPGRVILRNVIYSPVRPLRWLYPALSALGRAFLEQDARILRRLDAHASSHQPQLFVGPPDQPSAWYFQCKMALSRAASGAGTFVNPVRDTVLKWRT
jgi:phenylpropionate dioxygenase-like ring-hydroxylating dioxygenase large terminal subunit